MNLNLNGHFFTREIEAILIDHDGNLNVFFFPLQDGTPCETLLFFKLEVSKIRDLLDVPLENGR